MDIEYDPSKSQRNLNERGIAFDRAHDLDWSNAKIKEQLRDDQPEQRFIAVGKIDNRLHVLIFTLRGEKMRVISLRKANKREVIDYDNF